jgi:deoxyribonuclease-4
VPLGSKTARDLDLGAHQSIAGGTPRAIERGVAAGCRVVQIFVKNNNRWAGKTIEDEEAAEFRRLARRAGLSRVIAHTSYLINLASPSTELRRQSIGALADEILRCHALGIRDLVLHPGAHGGEGETAGIARVAACLDEAFRLTAATRVRVLLETAAGQGTSIGHRFEHLRDILGAAQQRRRLAVCFDTCHVHAAGYELSSPEGYAETLEAFERTVGLRNLAALHVNDSKKPKGSRVDRHEHIGRGSIGRGGFRNLMTDPRLSGIPKFLETPKDETLAFDRKNLATLRRLASPSPTGRGEGRGEGALVGLTPPCR